MATCHECKHRYNHRELGGYFLNDQYTCAECVEKTNRVHKTCITTWNNDYAVHVKQQSQAHAPDPRFLDPSLAIKIVKEKEEKKDSKP